ncbi:MAG: glycosyltransferase family 2 protein [Marinilabiliaceae bacterium]|nr:glycosyltransferase family 2 protein [Marinilabiliaceae bacterium]
MSRYTFALPAYKIQFLREAIQSIISQTYSDFRIIVSDDCSPYDVKTIVDEFHDERIVYKRNATNIGSKRLVAHWNNILSMVDSEYLIMASDDDVYAPLFLQEIDALTNSYPQNDIFRVRTEIIDDNSVVTEREHSLDIHMTQLEFIAEFYSTGHITCIGNYVFKTSALRRIDGFSYYNYAWGSDVVTPAILSSDGIVSSNTFLFKFRHSLLNISCNSADAEMEREKIDATMQYSTDLKKMINSINTDNSIVDSKIKKRIDNGIDNYLRNAILYGCKYMSLRELYNITKRNKHLYTFKYDIYILLKKWIYSRFK